MKQSADLIVDAPHVLTMEGEGVGYQADWALVVKDRQILDIGPRHQMLSAYTAPRRLGGEQFLLMPGLVDSHAHLSLAIFRGLAQDTSLWMHHGIGPWVPALTDEAAVVGAKVAAAEALLSGTTTIFDCSEPMDRIAAFLADLGIRAVVSTRVAEVPPVKHRLAEDDLYPFDPELGEKRFAAALKLEREWHNAAGGRITVCYAPQCLDQISLDLMARVWDHARRGGFKVMFHTAQGRREHTQMLKRYGKRTIPMLDELGYIDESLIAVHLTDATEEEAALVASKGASMVYCPSSNAITGGIVGPVHTFRQAGGPVGLGTDQAAGNNSQGVWAEMKIAAFTQKLRYQSPEVFPAGEVLRMATIEGARAIGLDHQVGSLRTGKNADFILVDLLRPGLTPHYIKPFRNFVPNLVYSVRGGQEVHTVVVDGRIVVEDGKLLTADLAALMQDANAAAAEMSQKVEELGTVRYSGVLSRQQAAGML